MDTPHPLDIKLHNSSLAALQSAAHVDLLNMMDKLRADGVSDYVSLPQLVVCGDQSSGKSSVLEAITEIPFPCKENLCTRFATQIVLRRSTTSKASVRIIPDGTRERSDAEKARLKEFERTIADFSDLGELIEEAAETMAIGSGFSKDILSVEISGPSRPHLTVVDLPGIIQTAVHQQTEDDIRMILDMVETFMNNPRTVILVVVSARNDYANQVVLRLARAADPEGKRIVGIITKPDQIPAGSESEKAFIGLARNEDEKNVFSLGWHVLRNRSFKERDTTFEERNRIEELFFSTSAWRAFPKGTVGIASLRTRLSTLLFKHIQNGLPGVHDDIHEGLKDCTNRLSKLGEKRSTLQEQRQFLSKLSHSFSSTVKAAVDVSYEDEYFEDAFTHLRSRIQNYNQSFAETMRTRGHLMQIKALESVEELLPSAEEKDSQPQVITEAQALNWVKPLLIGNRGRELPGTFNPMLIGNLFLEQSQRWEKHTQNHLDVVFEDCLEFLQSLSSSLANQDISDAISQLIVERMEERLASARCELDRLLRDRRRHAITYNHYFTENVQNSREKRQEETLRALVDDQADFRGNISTSAERLVVSLKKGHKAAMDDFAASEVLDQMQAYYKVALKTFVDNVAIQVIERHILDDIELIFSPMTVLSMPDQAIRKIAAESVEDQASRRQLELKKERLENGLDICKKALLRLDA